MQVSLHDFDFDETNFGGLINNLFLGSLPEKPCCLAKIIFQVFIKMPKL